MDEPYKVISTIKCETAQDLLDALDKMTETDSRGEEVSLATAVTIAFKYVQIECVEYADGTRTYILSGV